MWTREELKSNAKMILKRTYWMSFVACLILGVLSNGRSVFNVFSRSSGSNSSNSMEDWIKTLEQIQISPELFFMAMSVFFVVMILSVIYALFVSYPMLIGRGRFFMESREEDTELRNLFYGFTSGFYLHIVKTMFLVELYTALWSLLFVIPGIIKHYEYFFVPYILSENPGMDTKRAFELSREMSNGNKWNMFVLDLSFIGWYLLGALCCGIGALFVEPYYQATMAELYTASRAYAMQCRLTDTMELPGYVKQYYYENNGNGGF